VRFLHFLMTLDPSCYFIHNFKFIPVKTIEAQNLAFKWNDVDNKYNAPCSERYDSVASAGRRSLPSFRPQSHGHTTEEETRMANSASYIIPMLTEWIVFSAKRRICCKGYALERGM